MKQLFLILVIANCLVLIVNAQATNQPRDFSQFIEGYVAEIRDINEYYLSAPNPDGCGSSFNERIKCRNQVIRSKFEKIRTERRVEYDNYRFMMSKKKSCTSSVGNTKRCYASLSALEDHIIIPETLKKIGKGFKDGPTLASDRLSVDWTIGKSGKGRNVGGVVFQTRYTEEAILRFIERDIDLLKRTLRQRNLPDDVSINP